MKNWILVLLLFPSAAIAQIDHLPEAATITYPDIPEPYFVAYRKKPREQRHNLYIELGGPAGLGSFNYEWKFLRRNKFRMMLRPGFGVSPLSSDEKGAAFIFPVMIHSILGAVHNLDLGVGQTFVVTTNQDFYLYTPLSLGYRLEPKASRLFYRIAYTPIISNYSDFEVTHWGGISVGYKLRSSFKR